VYYRFKKTGIIIISCLVAVFLGTGCTQSEKPQDIVIGVAWPFATNNDLFSEGIDLAVREINENGGINGRELKLLKADDGAELEKGLKIAQSFAENKEIRAVIGHRNSFISIPASAIYEQAGLVMLSPASTAPGLTQNGYKHIFRCIPGDDEIARQMAVYLAGQGYRRMVIVYSDDSYGTGLANSFEDQAKAQGITIVDRFDNYTGLEDLKRLHNKWQAFGFDGIFIAENMPEAAQFIFDAGQAGINVPFFGGNTLESPLLSSIGGKAAEGTIVGSVFNPNIDRPEVKSFVLGLINYEKYGIIFLSEDGKEYGRFLLERHNVVEKFLKSLGIKENLLTETELVEHNISKNTMERINKLNEILEAHPEIIKEFENFNNRKNECK
jgi:branched-chain amino acid transport system substrate-binding protein